MLAAAIYLLLPRPRPYPVVAGAAARRRWRWCWPACSSSGTGALTPESFLFYVFSASAVVVGGMLVTQRNPARAALSFALVVLSTCGLFLLLAAPFLMAATIIIYAGAIIVTFLFVLMLAQQEGPSDADARSREPLLATLTGFVLLGRCSTCLQQLRAAQHPRDGRRSPSCTRSAKRRASHGRGPGATDRQASRRDGTNSFSAIRRCQYRVAASWTRLRGRRPRDWHRLVRADRTMPRQRSQPTGQARERSGRKLGASDTASLQPAASAPARRCPT